MSKYAKQCSEFTLVIPYAADRKDIAKEKNPNPKFVPIK